MKKFILYITFTFALFFAGCAGSSSSNPSYTNYRFLTGNLYLHTEIPVPTEIDLKFINKNHEYKYATPIYTYEWSLSAFTFIKDDVITRIRAMAPRYMKADTSFHPAENLSDPEYIDFYIKYVLTNYYPSAIKEDATYNNELNYGYSCHYPKDPDVIHCVALRITPQRNFVAIEMTAPTRSEENVKDWIVPTIESVDEKMVQK
jgi:hypothetical protein